MTNHSWVVQDFRQFALLCVMFSWSKHTLAGKGASVVVAEVRVTKRFLCFSCKPKYT